MTSIASVPVEVADALRGELDGLISRALADAEVQRAVRELAASGAASEGEVRARLRGQVAGQWEQVLRATGAEVTAYRDAREQYAAYPGERPRPVRQRRTWLDHPVVVRASALAYPVLPVAVAVGAGYAAVGARWGWGAFWGNVAGAAALVLLGFLALALSLEGRMWAERRMVTLFADGDPAAAARLRRWVRGTAAAWATVLGAAGVVVGLGEVYARHHLQVGRLAVVLLGLVCLSQPFFLFSTPADPGRPRPGVSESRRSLSRPGDATRRAVVATALERWQERALEAALLPELRQLLNELRRIPYRHDLTVTDAPGLRNLDSEELLIETASTKRLTQLLATIDQGALGLAGPRGAGKSTLISGLRSGRYLPTNARHIVLVLLAPVEYQGRDFALHLYAQCCEAIREYAHGALAQPGRFDVRTRYAVRAFTALGTALFLGLGAIPPLRAPHAVTSWLWAGGLWAGAVAQLASFPALKRFSASNRFPGRAEVRRLAEDCAERLRTVRYLQTHTSGWAGKVTVPFGGEASRSRQRQLAEQPLTYPVVVDSIRAVLGRATEVLALPPGLPARFVIAIDELDKIDSAERAQQFVNEIKSVFNAPGCHFVVSVSEEALAGFERRGLRLRDAFDSAFDEIVRVDYLSLDEASLLLQRRVIGLPIPFLCLAHCVAGGLPRELIRVARRMVDLSSEQPGIELGAVAGTLLTQDLGRAIRATLIELAALDAGTDLLELVRQLDPAIGGLPEAHRIDVAAQQGAQLTAAAPARGRWLEALAFSYYASTLHEIFDDGLDEATITARRTGEGSLEALARGRQFFAVDPRLAWVAINEVRATWGLAVVELAEPAVTVS